jgi:2-polyprenyl-3-methyl-5-hydroxy-6-metoxy-1,4-benzoquinol methylase
MMTPKTHWETIYHSKKATEVSWYQDRPVKSLEFIKATGVSNDGKILDAGGRASTLVDPLLDQGFRHVTVLDISGKALAAAKARLGRRMKRIGSDT